MAERTLGEFEELSKCHTLHPVTEPMVLAIVFTLVNNGTASSNGNHRVCTSSPIACSQQDVLRCTLGCGRSLDTDRHMMGNEEGDHLAIVLAMRQLEPLVNIEYIDFSQ